MAGTGIQYSPEKPRPKRYPNTFWPADDPEAGVPFTIRNGGDIDLGDIVISQIPLGRIHIDTGTLGCGEHTLLAMGAFRRFGWNSEQSIDLAPIPCGSPVTAEDVSPGDYIVQVVTQTERLTATDPPSTRMTAWTPVHIDEGADVDASPNFRPELRISGTLECACAEGWKDKVFGTRVTLAPAAAGIIRDYPNGVVDVDAAFLAGGTYNGGATLQLTPRPAGFAVKQILYNGAEVGTTFSPDAWVKTQSLRILLSDRPASFSGVAVSQDMTPQPVAHVVIAKWPLELNDHTYPIAVAAVTADDGRFRIENLGPGTWRAIAVERTVWLDSDRPGILAGWLSNGQELNLSEGERKQVTLETVEH